MIQIQTITHSRNPNNPDEYRETEHYKFTMVTEKQMYLMYIQFLLDPCCISFIVLSISQAGRLQKNKQTLMICRENRKEFASHH